MPEPGWLNQNQNRAFPFVSPLPGVANECVLDAGFVFDNGSGFDHGLHRVYLAGVLRNSGTTRFRFACDSPLLAGSFLDVVRPDTATSPTTYYMQSPQTTGETGCTSSRWEGFVTLGNCLSIAGTVADGNSMVWSAADNRIEPALLRDAQGTVVTSLNLANLDRTRATAPTGCTAFAAPPTSVWIVRTCLAGSVVLGGGNNAVLSSGDSVLSVQAQPGGGDGPSCGGLPLHPSETVPAGRTTLDGAWRCVDVLRSVNGVEGPHIFFRGESGVEITEDPANHRIVVSGNLTGLDICGSGAVSIVETV